MVDLGSVRDFALSVWDPSINNKGLPFGSLLHTAPPKRQRTLTEPLLLHEETFWQRFQVFSGTEHEQQTCLQNQCAFLSVLPLDIRAIIYEMVLGGMSFHLGNPNESKGRILCFVCRRPGHMNDDHHEVCFASTCHRRSSIPREDSEQATGMLPLLVTCRRIYSEAIDTLYSSNTFEFWQNQYAFRFLKVMLPQQRLRHIRRFRWAMQFPHHPSINSRSQRDWSDLFQFFTNETCGLQHLYLKLKRNHPMQTLIRETRDDDAVGWLQPIFLMALDAYRKRGCKVEIVTEGVVHDPVAVFNAAAQTYFNETYGKLLAIASAEMHRSIRHSIESPG